MKQLSVETVLRRYQKAKERRDTWRAIYQDAYEYAIPQRNLYDGAYEGGVQGQNKMQRVFDSTAIHATQRFANRMQSGLFPPYGRWCRLEPGTDIPVEKRVEVQSALDIYTDKMFAVIRQSNFDQVIGEYLLDLCVGTAAMIVQPGDKDMPVRFTAVPQYLVAFEEGEHGIPDNCFRQMRMKGEVIKATWPDAEFSDVMKKLIADKPEEDVALVEATMFDREKGGIVYMVICEKEKEAIVTRKRKISPWIVGRYMKVAGESYGRGPLVTALPDIKTLNKTVELLLKNASLAIAGVYTAADDGVLNPATVRIVPGAVIPVARNGGPQGESLRPLPRAGDFNVTQLVLQDLRLNVKKILLDDSLPPDNMSARSATEIAERMKELATNLGSAFGRLITETMVPIVSKTLAVMDEAGLIEMPLKVNGLEIKVVPISPIAQANAMGDVEKVVQWWQMTQALGEEASVTAKPAAIADFVADSMGVPARVRATPEEQAQKLQDLAQQRAAMMAMQAAGAMKGGGGGGGGAAPPLGDPNAAVAEAVQ